MTAAHGCWSSTTCCCNAAVKPDKFSQNPLQIGKKRVSYSGILQNANEMGRCRDERKESRRLVKFRTGGAARDHPSSGCAETKVGADGPAPLRHNEVRTCKDWCRLSALSAKKEFLRTSSGAGLAACRCEIGWYREQPRPMWTRLLFISLLPPSFGWSPSLKREASNMLIRN